MRNTNVSNLWQNPRVADGFRAAVSLHSHTSHSRESLAIIPQYAHKSKFLGRVMRAAEFQYLSRTGNVLDCGRAYWTPPLSAARAVALEARQIETRLHLPALVSLTDHDNCEAGFDVDGPVSIEWTVPLKPSFVHLGIHNLPRSEARALVSEMQRFTAAPRISQLSERLEALHRCEDVLIVLNHPLWDEGLIGTAQHTALIEAFLARFGGWIHALELNGLRSAGENDRVLQLAERYDLPGISGGDRHGREPNANVNLTRAETWEEFIAEVRRDKLSAVVYMPQYREPLRLRQFETAWDILRHDRDREDGCHSWCDRVFFTTEQDVTRPLSFFFGTAGPMIVMPFLAVMRVLEQPAVRPVLRAVFAE